MSRNGQIIMRSKKLLMAFLCAAVLCGNMTQVAGAADKTLTNGDSTDTTNYAKDTVIGGTTEIKGSISKTTNEYSVDGVTRISVTVPTSVAFTVDGSSESQITAADIVITNASPAPVVVSLGSFKKIAGDYEVVSDPTNVADWKALSHADRKISLGIFRPKNSGFNNTKNEVDTSAGSTIWANEMGNQNAVLGVLSQKGGSNTTGKLSLSSYHGTSFTEEEVNLNLGTYEIGWNISLY